jgi:hypothetical protein
VTGNFTGTGTWTQGANATLSVAGGTTSALAINTLNATSTGNTVIYNGAAQTCNTISTQYYNLTLGGSAAKTCAVTSVLGNLVYGGTGAWAVSSAITVNGALTVSGSGGSVTTAGFPFSVNGSTTISNGTLALNNSTGTKTLTGLVTLSGGTLSGAATSTVFGAGIANGGTGTVTITGSSTFATAGATLSGANLISIAYVAVTGSGTVTNNGTTTISGTLSGSGGTWTQGAGSTLNLSLVSASIVTVTNFDAHTYANDVYYTGAGAQTCLATQYRDLNFSGSGAKTCAPTQPILGNVIYNVSGSTWTLATTTTVNGALTISAGTLDVSANNYGLNLNGNFTNNGTFTARAGTVTLSGSSEQSLSGTMTGSSAFYNLTITNNSGVNPSNCELNGFTPSVAFLAGASSTATTTITTGNVGVQYNSGSAYGFNNTNWVGPSGQPIYFRNSVDSSGGWSLKVSGTQRPLFYINVSRSDASTGSSISAASVTNRDCGNNTNWAFGASSTSPTAYTQAAYKWFANQNDAQVGPVLAATNATATLTYAGEAFRLRMLLAVDATDSVAGTDSFMLQFANKGTGPSCASPQYSYANITSSTVLAYKTNSLVSDGTLLAPTSTDPADGGRLNGEQTYESVGTFTVTSTIPAGQDGNWDFSLKDNGSPGGTDYCIQTVFSSSTSLYAYPVYPEIITYGIPQTVTVSAVSIASSTITLTSATTTPMNVFATVSDTSGCANIAGGTTTVALYRYGVSSTCMAGGNDPRNCYLANAFTASSSCVGNSIYTTTTFQLYYFAQPTDGLSQFSGQGWQANVIFKNANNATSGLSSPTSTMNTLAAINVTTSSISYGTLAPGVTSAAQATTITNAGNSSTTLSLFASTTLTAGGGKTIGADYQHYATSSFTWSSGGSDVHLSTTSVAVSGFLLTAPTSTANVQSSIYWALQPPLGTASGTYTGVNQFTATYSP